MKTVTALLILAVGACAAPAPARAPAPVPPAAPAPALASALIEGVPHVRQKPDFCGEACAEMFLAKLGSKIDQDFVFDRSGLDPVEGRGCWTRDLSTALRRVGFQT